MCASWDSACHYLKHTSGIKRIYHTHVVISIKRPHQRIKFFSSRFGHCRRCARIATLGQLNRHILKPDQLGEQFTNELLGVLNGGRGSAESARATRWTSLATSTATGAQYADVCQYAQYCRRGWLRLQVSHIRQAYRIHSHRHRHFNVIDNVPLYLCYQ